MSLNMSFTSMTITAEEANDIYYALEVAKEACDNALRSDTHDVKETIDIAQNSRRYSDIMKRLRDRFEIVGQEG